MEGMRFTQNRQNTRSFGKFLAGNPKLPPCSLTLKCVRRYSSSQVTSDSVSRSETCRSVLFEIDIPCILLLLNRNKNSQNSPKRMQPNTCTYILPSTTSDLNLEVSFSHRVIVIGQFCGDFIGCKTQVEFSVVTVFCALCTLF